LINYRNKPFFHLFALALLLLSITAACHNSAATPSVKVSSAPTTEFTNPAPAVTLSLTAYQPIAPPTETATPQLDPSPTIKPSTTPSRQVILMAVGDVMLGRTIGDMIEAQGHEAPFQFTADALRSADITVGNLESPISARGTPEGKTYAFRAPLAAAESLGYGGFNLVNLANNHILDYGPLALADTLDSLAAQGIQSVGAGMNASEAHAPVMIEVNGLRLAFLGYLDVPPATYDYRSWEAGPNRPGVAWAHEELVHQGVTAAKAQADIVIVLVHNGYELVQQVGSQQQKIAHLAIDSGASLVIGSHPHVLQRVERYKDGLIAYSMGNFVFDNFLFPPNYSAILVVEFSHKGVVNYELIDVIVQLNGVPKINPYSLED
jgi:poly-gamma-glutamate capsule biosynthesis protein CapA/YwtB (metallophosphatase superfamily)